MKPGDCINIPAEVKHWHGAAPDRTKRTIFFCVSDT